MNDMIIVEKLVRIGEGKRPWSVVCINGTRNCCVHVQRTSSRWYIRHQPHMLDNLPRRLHGVISVTSKARWLERWNLYLSPRFSKPFQLVNIYQHAHHSLHQPWPLGRGRLLLILRRSTCEHDRDKSAASFLRCWFVLGGYQSAFFVGGLWRFRWCACDELVILNREWEISVCVTGETESAGWVCTWQPAMPSKLTVRRPMFQSSIQLTGFTLSERPATHECSTSRSELRTIHAWNESHFANTFVLHDPSQRKAPSLPPHPVVCRRLPLFSSFAPCVERGQKEEAYSMTKTIWN